MYSVRLKMTRFRNTVLNFVEKWNVYNVLCKVENDKISEHST